MLEGVRFLWLLAMDVRAAAARGDGVRSCFAPEALRGTLAMALAGQGEASRSPHVDADGECGAFAAGPGHARLYRLGHDRADAGSGRFRGAALTPSKRSAKRTRDRVDAEIDLTLGVIASIEADAHLTGR
ncbi:MAG: hypothetical protein ACLSDQ_05470 [Adlercreutzia equolifaciens]